MKKQCCRPTLSYAAANCKNTNVLGFSKEQRLTKKVAMTCFNFLSINKSQILASGLSNNSSSPSLPHRQSLHPSPPQSSNPTFDVAAKVTSSTPPLPKLRQTKQLQKPNKRKLSVLEIERAIGVGIFRDRDEDSDFEENQTLFDKIFLKYIEKTEGSVEKRLRETGEWISERSEKRIRSATKPILMFVAQWIFPMWICAFLIASGIIRLPLDIPWLDDLLM